MKGCRCVKIAVGLGLVLLLGGCADASGESGQLQESRHLREGEQLQESGQISLEEKRGTFGETAADGHIDFAMLQEKNPDIYAWLYIPGTDIDFPILQSPVSDDYYKHHMADGSTQETGALYTEMPNMMNMCDFNTVIHGDDTCENALFAQLHQFEDLDFFSEHELFYIYLPDNVLTYEIFAAYYDEESDILRRHDYTTYAGCQTHLDEIYRLRDMTKNQREGWDDLTPYHFLVTLDGTVNNGRQYAVIGVLINDAAGRIDRVIYD